MDETRSMSRTVSGPILRELGAAEQLFWWMNRRRAAQFAMAVETAGATAVEQWRTALAGLQKRHPLLSVSIAAGPTGKPVFRKALNAEIPLRLVPEGKVEDWPRVLEDELAVRFRETDAPLLRAVLLHRADRAALVLVAHHSVSDGISMALLIRDLMRALAGQSLEPLPIPPSSERLIERLPAIPAKEPPKQAPPNPMEYADGKLRLQIACAALGAAATLALRERSKREATTVHGALCAAAVLAGRAAVPDWREKDVRLNSPVSYRQILGAGEANGLYIGSGRMRFAPNPSAEFWDLARAAKAQVKDAASPASIQAFAARIGGAVAGLDTLQAAAKLAALTFSGEMILTNLGAMPYPSAFGSLKLEAVWGPALFMGFHQLLTLGAATLDGSLRLLLVDDGPVAPLLSAIERELRLACN